MKVEKLIGVNSDTFFVLILGLMQLLEPQYIPVLTWMMHEGSIYGVVETEYMRHFYSGEVKVKKGTDLEIVELILENTLTQLLLQYDIHIEKCYWLSSRVEITNQNFSHKYSCYVLLQEDDEIKLLDLWENLLVVNSFQLNISRKDIGLRIVNAYILPRNEILEWVKGKLQENQNLNSIRYDYVYDTNICLCLEIPEYSHIVLPWLIDTINTNVIAISKFFRLDSYYKRPTDEIKINVSLFLDCIKMERGIALDTIDIPFREDYILKLVGVDPIDTELIQRKIDYGNSGFKPYRLAL